MTAGPGRWLSLLLAAAGAGCAAPHTGAVGGADAVSIGSPLTGDWGGAHARLSLTADGGRIEYDCAQGTLDAPVVPDARGVFRVSGKHLPGHGGPEQIDAPPATMQPARYEGTVVGDRMELRVTISGQDPGSYILRRGAGAQLTRCL